MSSCACEKTRNEKEVKMRNKLRNRLLLILFSIAVFAVSVSISAQSGSIVIKAKKIYTVTRGTLENGEILIEGGKIREVGRKVNAPAGVREFNAEVVIPGMIDAHTHMALSRGSGRRTPGPVTAEWKSVDHFNPKDRMIPIVLSGGMTSAITRSGSGIISSGQSVAIKLKNNPEKDMVLKPYVDLKMAVRSLINLRPGQTPATNMGWYATASDYFRRAKVYLKKIEDYESGKIPQRPKKDERLEAFAAALRGEVMVHVHCHYPSELMMVMHLAKEFGFIDRLAFAHASESYPIAEVIAETKAIPVIGPVFITRFFGDSRSHNVVKELMEAGIVTSIQTDKGGEQLKCFREYGSFLIRHGLKEEHALQALTINGAKAMMLEKRIGSIEVGKDADLVLMDGSPFDLYAERIDKVFVDGILEYERKEARQPNSPTPVGPFKRIKGTVKPKSNTFAITNAHIFTVSHGIIPNGTLVVSDGKITDVQPRGSVPKGVPVMDVGGRVVLPGWITARAFPSNWTGDIKFQEQVNEDIEPVVPEMNARFGIDPWYPSFPVFRQIGVTAQNITPGHLNLIGGSGVVIKTAGMDIDKMVRKEPSCMVFSLTQRTARYWGKDSQIPIKLETAAEMIRDTLDAAKKYLEQRESEEYNQRYEALLPLLEGSIPVIIHANTVEEIRAAMKLAKDYKLRLVISGGVESHKLASELAQAGIGVILGDSGSSLESIRGGGSGFSDEAPVILSRAGVKVSFFGDSGSRRGMPTGRLGGEPALNAAWAFRNGATEEAAIRLVTLNVAEMFGMENRIGSIDVGKDADFMILEGHPFDYRVLPQMVFIDGYLVYKK
jgi:imidazolonepropionase-like amidohydrolase